MPANADFVYIPRASPTMDTDFYSPGVQILTCETTRLEASWARNSFSAPYWRLYWNPDAGASVRYAGEEIALGVRHVRLTQPLSVRMDGQTQQGVISLP
jgi:hypothetical protein